MHLAPVGRRHRDFPSRRVPEEREQTQFQKWGQPATDPAQSTPKSKYHGAKRVCAKKRPAKPYATVADLALSPDLSPKYMCVTKKHKGSW
ncbi:hypothetical protein ACU4GI_38520 [Cupriavidus basilensis]